MTRERSADEVAGAARRMIRALGRRVGDEDPVDLALIVELRGEVEAALTAAMDGQRRLFSDAEIGAGIGLSKQAVHKRLGARTSADADVA